MDLKDEFESEPFQKLLTLVCDINFIRWDIMDGNTRSHREILEKLNQVLEHIGINLDYCDNDFDSLRFK